MKKVKFYDIPAIVASNDYVLNFDGDKKDLRLHSENNFTWGGETKKEYKAAQKAIDKIGCKGKGWQLYAWYDVSSYEYWMNQQQEKNYIQVSISFENDTILESEIPLIVSALDTALAQAEAIENKYSFNRCY